MPEYDPRSAGHDYDWDSMTPDDAIEIVLERLADLHEALIGDWDDDHFANLDPRPKRDPSVPPHIQMVRWMPILSDYQMFAQRANKAAKDSRNARDELEAERGRLREEEYRLRREASNAVGALRRIESSLRDAVAVLDKDDEDG